MIVVIKNRGLGDCIIGLSSIAYIKKMNPDIPVFYMVPDWVYPVFANLTTPADGILAYNLSTFLKIKATKVIELHQRGSSKSTLKLLCKLKKIPYFYHNHNIPQGTFIHDQGVIKSAIQRDLDAIWSILYRGKNFAIPYYLDFPPQLALEIQFSKKKQLILGIMSSRLTKLWPRKHYLQLMELLSERFPDYDILIPLSKNKKDKIDILSATTLQNSKIPNNCKIIYPAIEELALLISESVLYFGNDSGPKHLAVALNIPSLTLFGPDGPPEWHPYDANKHPYFFIKELVCRQAAGKHYCGLSKCETMDCLKYFSALDAYYKIESMIDES